MSTEVTIAQELDSLFRCPQPLDMVKMRRLFLLFTQAHFSSTTHYGAYAAQLCGLTYNAVTPEAGGLKVALSDIFNPKNESQAPAVYVQFSGYEFLKLTLNNMGETPELGDRTEYIQKAKIEMTLLTVHNDSLDTAFYLAESGYDFFVGARPGIMDQLQLLSFDPVSLLKKAPKGQQPDKYHQVEAKFTMEAQLTVARLHESHLLKKVALYATQSV